MNQDLITKYKIHKKLFDNNKLQLLQLFGYSDKFTDRDAKALYRYLFEDEAN